MSERKWTHCDEKGPVARPTATYPDIGTVYCSFARVSPSQAIESDQWVDRYSPAPIDIPNTASIIVESRQGLTGDRPHNLPYRQHVYVPRDSHFHHAHASRV